MKFRIVKCNREQTEWYEVYYRLLWVWFPVTGAIEPPDQPRMFSTLEQAQHYIDIRVPKKPDNPNLVKPVIRTIVSEHDD